ncbi:IS3 family transposase, partial [Paeniglutamicibacter antarcticus]|nr:IS3 family transposase [Arthrobacter terrae]
MDAYTALTQQGIPTREAALTAGVSRATATRKPCPPVIVPAPAPVPVNKIGPDERAHILEVVNSARFVDLPPIQIYAQLLDEGKYLCSISTFYRVLEENSQVKERRRQARHPPRKVPELSATRPGQVYTCYA